MERTDFRWEDCEFSFGNGNFEMTTRLASGDMWWEAGYRSPGLEERSGLWFQF